MNIALWFGSFRPLSPLVSPDWNRNCVSFESTLKSRTGVPGSSLWRGYSGRSARVISPPATLRSTSSTSVTTRIVPGPVAADPASSGVGNAAPGAGAGAASPETVGISFARPVAAAVLVADSAAPPAAAAAGSGVLAGA